jgi:peptide/nickel transport system substrate-binding protein
MPEDWFNEGNDAGSGPYRVAAASKSSVSLEAFEGYRGGWPLKKFKKVFIMEVPDRLKRTSLLEDGRADIGFFPDIDRIAKGGKLELKMDKSWLSVIMMFNTAKSPCSNADFRKALAYAFPYEETVNRIMKGRASLSKGMIPPGMLAHDDSLPSYTLDLDKAAEHLEKSGLSGATVTLTYQTGRDELAEGMELFRRNLGKLGIKLLLMKVNWDTQQKMATAEDAMSRQDILVMDWWPNYADPAGSFQPLLSDQNLETGLNYSYMHDAEIDLDLQAASIRLLENPDEAVGIYRQVQEKVFDLCSLVFLYDTAVPVAHKNSLQGVQINPAYESTIFYYGVKRQDYQPMP